MTDALPSNIPSDKGVVVVEEEDLARSARKDGRGQKEGVVKEEEEKVGEEEEYVEFDHFNSKGMILEGFASKLLKQQKKQNLKAKLLHCSYRRGLYEIDPKRSQNADKILGAGTYGHVFTARLKVPGGLTKDVVIKQCRVKSIESRKTSSSVKAENDISIELAFNCTRLAYRELHILRHLTASDFKKDFSEGNKFQPGNKVELEYKSTAIDGDVVSAWQACTILSVDSGRKVVDLQRCDDKTAMGYLRDVPYVRIRFARSPYIVSIIDAFSPIANELCLTLERMDCDLKKILEPENKTLSTDEIRFIMYQLCAGLKYIHSANVFHRDIKPANILVSNRGGQYHIKITDFGMARVVDEMDHFENILNSNIVGTCFYNAPEVILSKSLRKPYNSAIDNWSIGCIFAELLKVQEETFNNAPICSVCGIDQLRNCMEVKDLVANYYSGVHNIDWVIDQYCHIKSMSISQPIGSLLPEEVVLLDSVVSKNNIQRARFKRGAYGINVHPLFCHACLLEDKEKKGFSNCYRSPFLIGDSPYAIVSEEKEGRDSQLMISLRVSGLPSYEAINELYNNTQGALTALRPLSYEFARQQLKQLVRSASGRSSNGSGSSGSIGSSSDKEGDAATVLQRFYRMRHKSDQSSNVSSIRKLNLKQVFLETNNTYPEAIDLLQQLLTFDSRTRITASNALEHPYLNRCKQRNKVTEFVYGGKDLLNAIQNKHKEVVESSIFGADLAASVDVLHRSINWEHGIYSQIYGPDYLSSLDRTTGRGGGHNSGVGSIAGAGGGIGSEVNSLSMSPHFLFESFEVKILSASGLAKADGFFGLSDPYTIVKWNDIESEIGRTPVIPNTLTPEWTTNNTFIISYPADSNPIYFSLICEVWDDDMIGTHDFLGGVVATDIFLKDWLQEASSLFGLSVGNRNSSSTSSSVSGGDAGDALSNNPDNKFSYRTITLTKVKHLPVEDQKLARGSIRMGIRQIHKSFKERRREDDGC